MLTLNFNSAVHKSWIFFSKPLGAFLKMRFARHIFCILLRKNISRST